MKQFSYVLTQNGALAAKPVGNLMREAARFSSRVRLSNGVKDAVLREQRDVMNLGLQGGNKITVTVEGADEEAAVAAIQNYVVENL